MLRYVSLDPLFRKYNHDNLTFSFFLRFFGKLCPADFPRRGGARQGIPDEQNAGQL